MFGLLSHCTLKVDRTTRTPWQVTTAACFEAALPETSHVWKSGVKKTREERKQGQDQKWKFISAFPIALAGCTSLPWFLSTGGGGQGGHPPCMMVEETMHFLQLVCSRTALYVTSSLLRCIVCLHFTLRAKHTGVHLQANGTDIFRWTRVCIFGPHQRLDELSQLPKQSGLCKKTNSGLFNQTALLWKCPKKKGKVSQPLYFFLSYHSKGLNAFKLKKILKNRNSAPPLMPVATKCHSVLYLSCLENSPNAC